MTIKIKLETEEDRFGLAKGSQEFWDNVEDCLKEIDSLREKLRIACRHWEMGIDIIYEDDPNDEEVEMERELLSKLRGT